MNCGIYSIYCNANDKYYIGQSIHINRRIGEHKRKLLKNIHNNCRLQNAWNLYGEECFEFEILELCSKKFLHIQEKFYIEYFQTTNRNFGFNLDEVVGPNKRRICEETRNKFIKINSGENNPNFGKRHSAQTIEKIKLANSGVVFSSERRKKISESRKGDKNPLFGRHRSEETKRKISDSNKGKNKGKKHTKETKKRMSAAKKGENNYMFGKSHTEETKRKISESMRNK